MSEIIPTNERHEKGKCSFPKSLEYPHFPISGWSSSYIAPVFLNMYIHVLLHISLYYAVMFTRNPVVDPLLLIVS